MKNRSDSGSPQSGEPVFLAIGRLRRPHGVRGEMQMEVLTHFPERLKPKMTVYVGEEQRPLFLNSIRPHGNALLVSFREYDVPETVGELRNQVLYVRVKEIPKLEEGEYYHHQIIGLRVIDEAGETLGKVTEILETGTNDVFIISREQGKDILLPAIDEDTIREVNIAEGWIRVHLLPGLLDEN